MCTVRGVIGHLDRDDVLHHVLAVIGAKRHPGDPGAEEGTPCLELPPPRQLTLGKQPLILRGLPGTDVDDDDIKLTHNAIMNRPGLPPTLRSLVHW